MITAIVVFTIGFIVARAVQRFRLVHWKELKGLYDELDVKTKAHTKALKLVSGWSKDGKISNDMKDEYLKIVEEAMNYHKH